MNSDRRILIIIFVGLFLILIAKGSTWFYENYEYKEVEMTSGYSLEARRNPFLAAEYFLQKLNLNVESDGSRAKFLEPHTKNETIFLNDYGPKLSPTRFNELKSWLEDGGHLIMTATDYYYTSTTDEDEDEDFSDYNQLLNEYGIRAFYTDFDDDNPYPDTEKVPLYRLKDGTDISISFYPDYHLVDTQDLASFTLEDEYGIHLLQIEIGNGYLTVLSDDYFLENYSIGENDHAYLLWLLSTANKSPNNKILLLYNSISDSIFALLWKHAKHACIAFILFIAMGLWTMQNRIGPIIPISDLNSRNVLEHLRAIARFSWRQDKGVRLLQHSRMICEQTLLSRYPVLKNMSTQERVEHLADVLNIPTRTIEKALYSEPSSTNEFITSSHHLQKIWILQ